jgi:hypothetical protein
MQSDKEYAIRLAMEYGFTGGFDAQGNLTFDAVVVEAILEAIAKAVEREREACAEICDRFQARDVGMQPAECAGAIRARRDGVTYGETTSRGKNES